MNKPNDKVTMKLHNKRLCVWPGNVTKWIERNSGGEVVVDKAPCIGHVTPVRLTSPTCETVVKCLPENFQRWLCEGMAVVIGRSELSEHARNLI